MTGLRTMIDGRGRSQARDSLPPPPVPPKDYDEKRCPQKSKRSRSRSILVTHDTIVRYETVWSSAPDIYRY